MPNVTPPNDVFVQGGLVRMPGPTQQNTSDERVRGAATTFMKDGMCLLLKDIA